MDIHVPQYLYVILVVVMLVVAAAVWMLARNSDGSMRIEPGEGGEPVRNHSASRASVSVPSPSVTPPAALAETKTETLSESTTNPPDRGLEQGYKGYKIQLQEKQPGLWIASIADISPRSRKRQAEDRKPSITHEYYQLPAALAEAKVMIDRRLAARR